jgi:hypothetical protein
MFAAEWEDRCGWWVEGGGGRMEAGDERNVGWAVGGPSRSLTFNLHPAESCGHPQSPMVPRILPFFHGSTVPQFHSTCILSSDSRRESENVRSRNPCLALPRDFGWPWRGVPYLCRSRHSSGSAWLLSREYEYRQSIRCPAAWDLPSGWWASGVVDSVPSTLDILNADDPFDNNHKPACQATAEGQRGYKGRTGSAPVVLALDTPIIFTTQRHTMQTPSRCDFYWAPRPWRHSIMGKPSRGWSTPCVWAPQRPDAISSGARLVGDWNAR